MSKQDKRRIEISGLLCAVDVYFGFCYTGSLFYPASSLSQFAYCVMWQKAAQRSLLRQIIVSRGLGHLFTYIAVNNTVLCVVFAEECAAAEFRLALLKKKLFSLQTEFVLVELKASLLNFFKDYIQCEDHCRAL